MKKLISLLLCLAMLLSLSVSAAATENETTEEITAEAETYAANFGTCGDDVYWSFKSGTLTIGGSGDMTDYASGTLKSYTKTPWYSLRNSITSVIIKDGVTSIGNAAFYYCYNLTSVEIPDSVTSIGSYAFFRCSSLTSLSIPSGVTEIGNYAFAECSSLTTINKFATTVTSVGNNAFYRIGSLSDVYYDLSKADRDNITDKGCNDELFNATWHYGKHSMKKVVACQARCESEGNYEYYICSDCGGYFKDEAGTTETSWYAEHIPATGHDYTDYKITADPTTSATGTLKGTCSRCNTRHTVTMPKLSTTDYTYKVTKEATCTEEGTATYTWKDTSYGTQIVTVTLSPTGHNFVNGVCTVCGGSETVTITRLYNPATGEHMLASSSKEISTLKAAGWSVDGVMCYIYSPTITVTVGRGVTK